MDSFLETNSTPLAVSRSTSSSRSRVLRAKRLMDSTTMVSPCRTNSIMRISSGRSAFLPLALSMKRISTPRDSSRTSCRMVFCSWVETRM